MLKTYFIYYPLSEGNISVEWEQCFKQINKTILSGYQAVKLNIFTDLPDYDAFLSFRRIISKSVFNTYKSYCPALNITVHPPEKPWKIAVEATFILSDSVRISGKKFQDIPYIILESETTKEVWAGGVSSYLYPDDTRRAAEDAFKLMVALLEQEQMTLNHLVRQWNYIGDILSVKDGYQNYQVFNEVRNDYYRRYRNIKGFPAATGVGMKFGNVVLDFCAVRSDASLKISPVQNPDQVNAYNYDQQVLKGVVDKDKSVKHPPQFERALLIVNNHEAFLHISGTASIIGQATVGLEDIEKQTIVTIENIKKLADKQRISQYISSPFLYNEKFTLLRVYIKKQNDFNIVRQICEKHFPQVPAIYLEADICRDDLLMEIEAEVDLYS